MESRVFLSKRVASTQPSRLCIGISKRGAAANLPWSSAQQRGLHPLPRPAHCHAMSDAGGFQACRLLAHLASLEEFCGSVLPSGRLLCLPMHTLCDVWESWSVLFTQH
eukprot:487940-Rhodomonas_salina.1